MSSYSQKRQRTSGSFSPASPPYHVEAVKSDHSKVLDKQPQTPLSPSPMSFTSQNNASFNFSNTSYPNTSPPSSLAMSQPVLTGTCEQAKVESEINNERSKLNTDPDLRMPNPPAVDIAQISGSFEDLKGLDHRRTNHDRYNGLSREWEQSSPKRLNNAFFPLFKLCEYPHPISRPHPSDNLISQYHLDKVAASVARKDPVTGEKINKLRKSYEGKVKALQLAGKNKAVSTPNEFTNMLLFPDEEWQNQRVFGKSVEDGLPSSLLSKLDKAVQANPGPLPARENERWKSIIGADEPPKITAKKSSQSFSHPFSSQTLPLATRPGRPERAGKKRSYLDSSFKGYGEGFLDDDPIGVSAGEDEGRGALSKKKRRKMGQDEYANVNSLSLGDRNNNLGVSLVGVGNGSF